ncbi:MAG: hypothetical protein ABUS51_05085 [Acidobacteriota bacterium]
MVFATLAGLTTIAGVARAAEQRSLIFSGSNCGIVPGPADAGSVPGSCTVSPFPAAAASGDRTLAFEFSAFGGDSGSMTGTLPWNFILSADTSVIHNTLDISAFTGPAAGGGGAVHISSTSDGALSGTEISDGGFLALSEDTTAWAIDLMISAASATLFEVNIPDVGGIDLHTSSEPASFLLLGPGVASLVLVHRRKAA